MSKEAENLMAAMKELHALRARVGALEELERWHAFKLEERSDELIKLRARAESAEARVTELEARAAGYLHAFKDGCERSIEAVAALESQLAAAREEQGLEDRVATALGPRYQALQLTRLAMSGIWQACWCAPAWSSRNERKAQAPTLPALLRAILEVEAKGG